MIAKWDLGDLLSKIFMDNNKKEKLPMYIVMMNMKV